MSSSIALRQARHLKTTAAAVASSPSTITISISKAKSKLKAEHDPDKALEIYSSVSDRYVSPLSSRYAQEFTVKRLAKSHHFSDIENFLESHKNRPKIFIHNSFLWCRRHVWSHTQNLSSDGWFRHPQTSYFLQCAFISLRALKTIWLCPPAAWWNFSEVCIFTW